MTQYGTVKGSEVRVGDILEVWWNPGRDTVTGIRPYEGRLDCMKGGWIFEFALLPSGSMTVAPNDRFQRVSMTFKRRKPS